MIQEQEVNLFLNLGEQTTELFSAYKDAKEDGKIRPWELFKILREASDVVKASKAIDANSIIDLTEQQIQDLAAFVIDSVNRPIKITHDDLVNSFRICQNATEIIFRERS